MSMFYATGQVYFCIASGNRVGSRPRPRASGGEFRAGEGGGDFRAVGNGQAVGRNAEGGFGDTFHALGHDPRLRKTGGFFAEKAARSRKRPSWQRSGTAGAGRPLRGASAAVLSALPGTLEAIERRPCAVCGGYSR